MRGVGLRPKVYVSADGSGVVGHAVTAPLRYPSHA